jgi:hypothetical protein
MRTSFDALAERARALRLSLDEAELLRETHWNLGQDARLREDVRFRPTPWKRWMLSESFLANDAVCAQLHRERRVSLALEPTLAALDGDVRRRCVVCPADPRLVVEDDEVRLSARELTDHPLLEESVTEMERYVTHLPLHSLQAVAASLPAGEWGRRAQEEVIETVGWIRVSMPGRKLNPQMFVAQIEGHSMDDGKSGLIDGRYAIFELSPSGTKQNLSVLVRGAFSDPETGSYAVKKYVADERDQDGRHHRVRLVSLNADKQRFPDIELTPENDDDIFVVAKVVHALAPGEFAREPRPVQRRGRRDLSSLRAREDIAATLTDGAQRFFEPEEEEPSLPDEEPQKTTWKAEFVCLDGASGGLHVEVGPLAGLWSFVKQVRAQGEGWSSVVFASNVRQRPVRLAVPPSSGPWRWAAIGFEDDPDVDLSVLTLGAVPNDRPHVFRVDAEGIGRLLGGRVLSSGQRYRVLVPSAFVGTAQEAHLEPCGEGWLLWEVVVPSAVSADLIESARRLGLDIGERTPSISWVVSPPTEWRTNRRGVSYACFESSPGPVVELEAFSVDVDEDASVFVHGPRGTESVALHAGECHLVHLAELEAGQYMLAALHRRTAVPVLQLAFEIVEATRQPPAAIARVTIGAESHSATAGQLVLAGSYDLGALETADALETLAVEVPPGWPVRVGWRELVEEVLLRRSADASGRWDTTGLAPKAQGRFSRRPVGDVIFDFQELGRIALRHDRRPEPAAIRTRFGELLATRAATVERLAGAFDDLMQIWFEPICASLGFDVESLPEDHIPVSTEHARAFRLLHVERRASRIERQPVRLLVLLERVPTALSPEMLAWIDEACAIERLREVLLSDGLRWAAHRRGSRLGLHVWDLGAVTSDAHEFDSFLHDASEGI